MEIVKLIKTLQKDFIFRVSYDGDIYELYKTSTNQYSHYHGYLLKINPYKKQYLLPNNIIYKNNIYDILLGYEFSTTYEDHPSVLEEFYVEENNNFYIAKDGILYKKDYIEDIVMIYPRKKNDRYYIIPKLYPYYMDNVHLKYQLEENRYIKGVVYKNKTIIKQNNSWKII